jgi:hypothetical protein
MAAIIGVLAADEGKTKPARVGVSGGVGLRHHARESFILSDLWCQSQGLLQAAAAPSPAATFRNERLLTRGMAYTREKRPRQVASSVTQRLFENQMAGRSGT